MKKKIILFSLLFVFLIICFIPLTQQKTIVIKASFYNVYQQLANVSQWQKWRKDIRKVYLTDSAKISNKQDTSGLKITYADFKLTVKPVNGYSFQVNEQANNKVFEYVYTVLPEKSATETKITIRESVNMLHYALNGFKTKLLTETHITDFKEFMENVNLYYGYDIVKTKITDTAIIVLRRMVLAKNKFSEAQKSINLLRNFAADNGLRQTQPFIAQFLPRGNDSMRLNIGIPVNKKVAVKKPIDYMEMPAGNTYTAKFHGPFSEKTKIYTAIQRYFNDRHLQMPALPFETYLDNKLPLSDTSYINIRVNFPSY